MEGGSQAVSTVDERVVILEFNNAQFETNVKQSVSTLQKLKESLNLEGSAKGLDQLNKSARSFSMTQVADNIQTVADRFSALGIVGDQVLRRLTDKAIDLGKSLITAIPNQIISGGKRRAQNIEQAKFMLEGLLGEAYDWEKIQEDINYAVSGTAYGFDEAASAAGQLAASSVEFGDDMKAALRGISGVAAMTNDEYGTIAQIFTKIAGQGKVMSQELNQLAAHGINAAATLGKVFDVTEADIREMVKHGEVDFQMFSYAMDRAFGEHAKNANATFQGVLRNVKASLSRMGEQFATPAYDNLRLILVALLPVMKDIEAFIKPISNGFKGLAESVSGAVVPALESLHYWFAGIRGLQQDYDFSDLVNKWASKLNGMTREEAKELGLFNDMLDDFAERESAIKDSLTDENTKQTFYDSTLLDKDKNYALGAIEEVVDAVEEGNKMNFNPLLDVLGTATKTAETLEQVEKDTKSVEKAAESANEANEEAKTSAKETQKEYKKTSKYAKSFSNVQESVANSTKTAYTELEQRGASGKFFANVLRKLTKEEQKRAQTQADLSTENAKNEKVAIEMSQRSAAEAKKENLFQKVRNKLIQGTSGALGKAARAAANFLGFNEETVKALASEEQMQQVVTDLANRGIKGEFGNGQDRIDALKKLGAAYPIVQNRINELLNCEKRHTVTAEDEAQMMEYVCQTLGITSKEGKRIATIFDSITKIFAGFIGLLETIKIFGMAILTEIIQPFAEMAFQTILAAILPPLGAIGDALAGFYASLNPEDVTKFFSDVRESIVAFWNKVQELEGVKKLKEAWETFKLVLDNFRKKVVEKLTTKFEELRKNFKLPEGSFFLNIIDNITNGLSHLVDLLSSGVAIIGEFFSPLVDWITSIPRKLKEFWDFLWSKDDGEEAANGFGIVGEAIRNFITTINNFIDSVAPLKAIKDFFVGFWGSIFGKKDKKNTFEKMFGKADEKIGALRKAWNEGLDPRSMLYPFELLKKRVDDFTNSIAPLKAVKDWMKDFWNTIFGTPGEGEDPANYGFGAAFDKLKQQISDFMDSVPILKTIKDWFKSIFNENLAKSITDVGKAIGDFFKALFDKQEEGEGTPLPFGERLIQAAERLKERIVKIFGSSPELGKLLMAGGGIGFGILKLISSMKILKSLTQNQNGEGIAGAIFGAAGGGISKVPLMIGGLLGLSAALNMFGIEFKRTTEDGEQNILFIEFLWDKLVAFLGNTTESIKSLDIGGKIYELLFGKKGEGTQSSQKASKGIVDNITSTLQTISNTVTNTIGVLFGGKDGKLGLGGGLGIMGAVAGIYLIITAFKTLGKALSGMLSIFTGAAGMLGDIRVALSAYTDNLRANTFLSFAKAFGVFALGLAALAMVPTENLYGVIAAVTWLAIVIAGLIGVFNFFTKVNKYSDEISAANTVVLTFVRSLAAAFKTAATMAGIGLLFTGIALAVGILVGAITKLASMKNLAGAMDAFKTIMLNLVEIMAVVAISASTGSGIGKEMVLMSVGIMALAYALKVFETVDSNAIGAMVPVIIIATAALFGLVALSKRVGDVSKGFGVQFVLISAGLIAFAYACKMLEGVKFEYVAGGIVALALALAALCVVSAVGKGGGSIAGLGVALLGFAVACIIIGKNAIPAAAGMALLAAAFAVFSLIASKMTSKVNLQMITFSKSLFKLGVGVLALAVAFPILGFACKMFGEMVFTSLSSAAKTLGALGIFVGVLFVLGKISAITAPEILLLGKSLMFVAIAINLIVGVFTGFKGIRGLIGEIAGGIGDILGSFMSLPGSMLNAFTNTSKAVKNSGSDYKTAAESYKQALTTIEGLSSSTASILTEKMEALKELDGHEYVIGVKNVVAYIETLDIDENKKRALINRTLRTAERQQHEAYQLVLYNIEVTLSENGATQKQIDGVFKDLQDAFDKSPGGITARLNKLDTYIEGLPISEEDKAELLTAVDDAVTAQVNFQVSLKQLRAIINEDTTVTPEGKEILNSEIDRILSGWSYKTDLKNIEAWVKTEGVNVKNKIGLFSTIKTALSEKEKFEFNLGKIYGIVDELTETDVDKEKVKEKIQTELNNIWTMASEGEDVEVLKTELHKIKAEVKDLFPQITWDKEVETQLDTYLDQAFDNILSSYEGYHVALNDINLILDSEDITPEQRKAFQGLINGLWENSEGKPADIGKLWITCKDLGMSTSDMIALMDQLGVTLNEQANKEILLSGVHIVMEKAGLDEEQQEAIDAQLEEFDKLPEEVLNDAEEFQKARNKAIEEMTKITGNKGLAIQMFNEYYQEKKDLKNASLGVLEGSLESVVFGTDFELDYFKGKLENMYGLYGKALEEAMTAFVEDIKNHSSLSDEDKAIIAEQAGQVVAAQKEGIDEEYRQLLEYQAKMRREENIGAFALNLQNGSYIGGNTAVSKTVKDVFGELEGAGDGTELTVERYGELIQKLKEEGYTWEQVVASFENTGLTDQELAEMFFPTDPDKIEVTREGFEFMKAYLNPWFSGASQARQEELKKYGKYDYFKYLDKYQKGDKYIIEHGKKGNAINGEEAYTQTFNQDQMYSKIESEMTGVAEKVKEYRKEINSELTDQDPVTVEEMYSWYFGANDGQAIYGAPVFSEILNGIHEDVLELVNGGLEEKEALEIVFTDLRQYLYATGDGIVTAAGETAMDLQKAFDETFSEVEDKTGLARKMAKLRKVFDPTGAYNSNGMLFEYLKTNIFGVGYTKDLNIEDLLKREDLSPDELIDEYFRVISESMKPGAENKIDPETLVRLYKAFPSFRELFKEYLNDEDHPERKEGLGDEWNSSNMDKIIQEQITDVQNQFTDAIKQAGSGNSEDSTEAYNILQELFGSGKLTPAEAQEWIKGIDLSNLDLSGLAEKFGFSIEGMSTEGITNAFSNLFSGNSILTSLTGTGDDLGGYLTGGLSQRLEEDAESLYQSGYDNLGDPPARGAEDAMQAQSPSKRMKQLGIWAVIGLRQGIIQNKKRAVEAFKKMAEQCVEAVNALVSKYLSMGSDSAIEYGTGIVSHPQYINLAGATVVRQASDGI